MNFSGLLPSCSACCSQIWRCYRVGNFVTFGSQGNTWGTVEWQKTPSNADWQPSWRLM